MNINEFLHIMKKTKMFQLRLAEENITSRQAETILKVYINDLTDRINTSMLKVV